MSLPIALQLYTIRKETEKDFPGALEKVAETGYKGVEFAGFGDIPAAKMRERLDSLGLKAVASHTALDLLKNSLEEVLEYNMEIGGSYIICPYAKPETAADYLELARLLNRVAQRCADKGLQFAYHNHAHEFERVNGGYGLDFLYRETDPRLVKVEMDTFWAEHAGVHAAEYMLKYAGRCPLVHLKDMDSRESKNFTEVGEGVLDMAAICASAEKIGAEWLIVEQDLCRRPEFESIKVSYDNLKKMKLI